MAVKYRTPHKYEDNDIWFRFFTKTELLLLAPAFIIDGILIYKYIAASLSEWIFAAIIIVLVTAPSFVFAKASVPKRMPLMGGGIKIRKVGTRVLFYYLFKSGRTIYVKNYKKDWKRDNT